MFFWGGMKCPKLFVENRIDLILINDTILNGLAVSGDGKVRFKFISTFCNFLKKPRL